MLLQEKQLLQVGLELGVEHGGGRSRLHLATSRGPPHFRNYVPSALRTKNIIIDSTSCQMRPSVDYIIALLIPPAHPLRQRLQGVVVKADLVLQRVGGKNGQPLRDECIVDVYVTLCVCITQTH